MSCRHKSHHQLSEGCPHLTPSSSLEELVTLLKQLDQNCNREENKCQYAEHDKLQDGINKACTVPEGLPHPRPSNRSKLVCQLFFQAPGTLDRVPFGIIEGFLPTHVTGQTAAVLAFIVAPGANDVVVSLPLVPVLPHSLVDVQLGAPARLLLASQAVAEISRVPRQHVVAAPAVPPFGLGHPPVCEPQRQAVA